MVLPFSTKLNGKTTFFIEKIWLGLIEHGFQSYSECNQYQKKHLSRFGDLWDHDEDKNLITRQTPKIHTIRMDAGGFWRPGMKIHFVINNRLKTRFQFAPVLQVVSVQEITIISEEFNGTRWDCVMVGDRMLTFCELQSLAINDGFNSAKEFFAYFTNNWKDKRFTFTGKIIHWTNKSY